MLRIVNPIEGRLSLFGGVYPSLMPSCKGVSDPKRNVSMLILLTTKVIGTQRPKLRRPIEEFHKEVQPRSDKYECFQIVDRRSVRTNHSLVQDEVTYTLDVRAHIAEALLVCGRQCLEACQRLELRGVRDVAALVSRIAFNVRDQFQESLVSTVFCEACLVLLPAIVEGVQLASDA